MESQKLERFAVEKLSDFHKLIVENHAPFSDLKKYIDTKHINPGLIHDLRYSPQDAEKQKKYADLSELNQFIFCVYQVRCNLFHGGKHPEDGQDECLVKLSYESLVILLEKIYCEEGLKFNND